MGLPKSGAKMLSILNDLFDECLLLIKFAILNTCVISVEMMLCLASMTELSASKQLVPYLKAKKDGSSIESGILNRFLTGGRPLFVRFLSFVFMDSSTAIRWNICAKGLKEKRRLLIKHGAKGFPLLGRAPPEGDGRRDLSILRFLIVLN